ncbi:hypothetical protein [Mycobacterium sp. NPDC050041]|uniref:hypothetical protein n=1 Tax=Mycobacterium sp. NPDC050041 TaxID=3364293 RepID=UPI003C3085FF
MNTIVRVLALPVLSAGIIGGAALGLAGTASAAPPSAPQDPGHSYVQPTKAKPTAQQMKGSHHRKKVMRHHRRHH